MVSRRFQTFYPNPIHRVGHAGRPVRHDRLLALPRCPAVIRPLRSVEGKAAYWLLLGLSLWVVAIGGLLSYREGWMGGKGQRSVVALSRNEGQPQAPRYKIERPPSPPVTNGPLRQTEGPKADQPEIGPAPAGESAPVRMEPKPAVRSPDASSSAVMALPEEDAEGEKGETTVENPAPSMENGGEPGGPVSAPPTEPAEETPLRYAFVKDGGANVREHPSMRGKSLFLVRQGSSVRVMGEEKGWSRIRLEDGRSGWVRQIRLSAAPDAARETSARYNQLRAIRVEPPVDQKARVFFRAGTLVVPEMQVLQGKNPRVVLDFPDTVAGPGLKNRLSVDNGMIRTVRIGRHERPRTKLRVVLDLQPGLRYEARQVGSGDGGDVGVEIRGVGHP